MNSKELEAACLACGFVKTEKSDDEHTSWIISGDFVEGPPFPPGPNGQEWILHQDHPALVPLVAEILSDQIARDASRRFGFDFHVFATLREDKT